MLSAVDKKKIGDAVKHAKQIDFARRLGRIVKHVDPPPGVVRLRTRLEKSLAKWLKHFLPESFCDPWSDDHKKIISKIERCIKSGGLFAEAMPRGQGKTTIIKGGVLFAMLTGQRKFVMPIAATAEMSEAIVDFIRRQITENDKIHEAYPHVTTYARATDGKAIKARYQLRGDGKLSGIMWSKNTLVLPEVVDANGKGYPSNGAILEAHGLTGAIRGTWKDTKTGKVLRPDFAILDDPQTRESAESASQCDMRERIITGDVLGLAGPRKRIAAIMPCTIVRKGDLADRFLDHKIHPEWQGETCPLVYKWPDTQDTLWLEYANIYKEDTETGDGMKKATDFYLANREKMDAGAVVAWSERIRDGEVSAIQTAENLLLECGPQFYAEYQNAPLTLSSSNYEITPALVSARVNGFRRLCAPADIDYIVAAGDVNYVGINWTILAANRTGIIYCIAYGCFTNGKSVLFDPKTQSKQLEGQAIINACLAWMREINSVTVMVGDKPQHVSMAGIDCGNWTDAIIASIYSVRLPVRMIPIRGVPAIRYKPQKGCLKYGEGWHVADWRKGKILAVNADLYRETVQRSFLSQPGTPGSISLHQPDYPTAHLSFAKEICGETLSEHIQTSTSDFYKWTHEAGQRWDKLDALCYTRALLAYCGLSASGIMTVKKQYVEQRKAKVVVEL